MTDKASRPASQAPQASLPSKRRSWRVKAACATGLLCLAGLYGRPLGTWRHCHSHDSIEASVYGEYPRPDDPFLFLPCTNATLPPALDDADPRGSWSGLYDPDPGHWSWGNLTSGAAAGDDDPYAGRGIYMCGYLDVPLDHLNASDPRIVRLAVNKFQVSGLARADGLSAPAAGRKSERTLVTNPGGPGGSGTSYVWRAAEDISKRLSHGQFDVLGWDPRGVNASQPALACFPYDSDRDRWSMLVNQYREVSASTRAQLELADAPQRLHLPRLQGGPR